MIVLLPLSAALAALWPSFVALHENWVNWSLTAHAHGYLIAGISVWLLLRAPRVPNDLEGVSRPMHFLPLVISGPFWLVAYLAAVQAAEFALVPIIMWSVVLAGCGWQAARRATFPIAYFYLATPLFEVLNPLFQWTSVYAVRFALRLYGIPAYFDANHVQIPAGTFEIAGGCSGLHFAVVGLAIALLVGELRRDVWKTRVKLILIALVLSMMTNWVRVFVIILAGHYTHMQHYLVAQSHYFFGWAVFSIALFIFFLIERRMQLTPASRAYDGVSSSSYLSQGARVLCVWIFLATLVTWRLAALRPSEMALPPDSGARGWTKQAVPTSDWYPQFAGIDEHRIDQFSKNKISASRYIGLYRVQKQGKEIDGYFNDPWGGLVKGNVQGPVARQGLGTVNLVESSNGESALVSLVYRVYDKKFSSSFSAKVWYALRSLIDLRAPPTFVQVLRIDCTGDCRTAADGLREFGEAL